MRLPILTPHVMTKIFARQVADILAETKIRFLFWKCMISCSTNVKLQEPPRRLTPSLQIVYIGFARQVAQKNYLM